MSEIHKLKPYHYKQSKAGDSKGVNCRDIKGGKRFTGIRVGSDLDVCVREAINITNYIDKVLGYRIQQNV